MPAQVTEAAVLGESPQPPAAAVVATPLPPASGGNGTAVRHASRCTLMRGRFAAGGLFLVLVVAALFSDCFAWRMGSATRPMAEFIRAAFAAEADAHRAVMRREDKEELGNPTVGLSLAALGERTMPVPEVSSAPPPAGIPAKASFQVERHAELESPASDLSSVVTGQQAVVPGKAAVAPPEQPAVAAPSPQPAAGAPPEHVEAKVSTQLAAAVQPDGLQAKAAADAGGGGEPPGSTNGFYFPVFQEVPGTLHVIGQVRHFYPESPIHLLQDGGALDFSAVCRLPKYNCTYEWLPAENSRWNPHSWFERMLSVAKRLRTTYIIYLEPDVLVRHRHRSEPKHDAGGMHDDYNPRTTRDTKVYLERRGRERNPCFQLRWHHFGLAGGSYFRTEALLDAFDPKHVARLDFAGMEKKEGHRAMSSDFAMLVALASRGWTVYPWEEASQNFPSAPRDKQGREAFRRRTPAWNPDAAFEHAHKEHYGTQVPQQELDLMRPVSGHDSVTCHGCVWRAGERLDRKLPIPSKAPRPPKQEDRYSPSQLSRLPLPHRCPPLGGAAAGPADAPGKGSVNGTGRAAEGAGRGYAEVLYAEGFECRAQAHDLGPVETAALCDELASATGGCGGHFMFSPRHIDWACRCCAAGGEVDGPAQEEWNVYVVQTTPAAKPGAAAPPPAVPRPAPAELTADPEPAPPPPEPAEPSGYQPVVYVKGRECETQAKNFGFLATMAECDRATAAEAKCGGHFMFSKNHPSWQCRCCSRDGPDDGPESLQWSVYAVQSPMPQSRRPPPLTPLSAGAGLPVAEGPRPSWLVKEDGLVMDAHNSSSAGGGMLILQAVLTDSHAEWGKKRGRRPRWLRAILAANREHARLFGHTMALRWAPSQPQLTWWQLARCRRERKRNNTCTKDNERENYNWEKHLMMAEYLNSPRNFSHVFMLDADAALVRPDHDTLQQLASVLEESGKDVFLSDEDWLRNGKGRINGGLIFVKNTAFTRGLFNDTFEAHCLGRPLKVWRIGVRDLQCTSNEQICLNDLWTGAGKAIFAPHALVASGMKYNRGGCVLHGCGDGGMSDPRMKALGMGDPELEVMHFMGGSKSAAGDALCKDRDLTGEGPQGYGCRK